MTSEKQVPLPDDKESSFVASEHRGRFLFIAISGPTIFAAMGVDGGSIFQIVAVESLGLSPHLIGLGLGLGMVSIPIQLWAARTPFHKAKRNLVLFYWTATLGCLSLATMVAIASPGADISILALAIALGAEIAVSIFFVPAWQPLLSEGLSPRDRQQVNARGYAGSRILLAIFLLVFGTVGDHFRTIVLASLALVSLSLVHNAAALVGSVNIRRPTPPESEATLSHLRFSTRIKLLMVGTAMLNLGAWPLFLVYVHETLWPTVNLGLVATIQMISGIAGATAWRSDEGNVERRTLLAGIVFSGTSIGVALMPAPIEEMPLGVVLLLLVALAGMSSRTVFLGLLELTHRTVQSDSKVRTFTIYDVVGSTSLQVGLLVGGLLMSVSPAGWLTDPYRVYLVALGAALVLILVRLQRGAAVVQARH